MTRNFRWRRRTSERLQNFIFGNSWPAAISQRLWPPKFRVWNEQLALPKSLGSAQRLRIAFASDFHAGPLTPPISIHRACEALNAARAELILLGGDFASIHHRHIRHLIEPFRTLRAPLGVHAVLGNHDHWAGAAEVTDMLHTAGVNLLLNRSLSLPAPWENTLLVGLDDHLCGYPDASRAEWVADRATLLLIHEPSGILDAANNGFDIAFAGHTHGGQITMPGGFAPIAPEGVLSRRYLRGRHELQHGRTLCVSVGIGNTGLPLRFGPVPEILVCDVTGSSAR